MVLVVPVAVCCLGHVKTYDWLIDSSLQYGIIWYVCLLDILMTKCSWLCARANQRERATLLPHTDVLTVLVIWRPHHSQVITHWTSCSSEPLSSMSMQIAWEQENCWVKRMSCSQVARCFIRQVYGADSVSGYLWLNGNLYRFCETLMTELLIWGLILLQ